MPRISIRMALNEDAATVARLVHALLEELSGGKSPTIEGVTQVAKTVLADPSVVALIACADDQPVGVMTLNECTAIYAGGKFGEISELYVLPELRSQGISRQLLDHAQMQARDRGWKRIEVGTPSQPEWHRTLEFYLSNGFGQVGPRLRRLIQVEGP